MEKLPFKFQHFKKDISSVSLPEKFTFPFYYDPHTLVLMATEEVQDYLTTTEELNHDFGMKGEDSVVPVGKMFGVLVVQSSSGEIGYLAAYSGKIIDEEIPEMFVPPVFDIFQTNSFYRVGEEELNDLNARIYQMEASENYYRLKQDVEKYSDEVSRILSKEKAHLKKTKKERQVRRADAQEKMTLAEFEEFNALLAKESIAGQLRVKKMTQELKFNLAQKQEKLDEVVSEIQSLKKLRKKKSAILQQQIFDCYQFLNRHKEKKSLVDIFPNFEEQKPPSGAGDCSAPKLLQYAFLHDLHPLAMGEFWWGSSPDKEIRKHKTFYPACGSRCKPILAHMLKGLDMEENPFLKIPQTTQEIQVIYEDKEIVVLNKPAELMTVPGKMINESVYTRMKAKLPTATGPLIVHRLDMSTSGILVITKTKEANKKVQAQFIQRTVKKRYVALLDGIIEEDEGLIDLPLRVDLDDRPRQLVCYEYGKPAQTRWKVVERRDGKTRIHFFPLTGRTHQLRVHASHPKGLNTPIVGDDLYGHKENRLHLHAEYIAFLHPKTKKEMTFTVAPDF